MRNWLKTMLFLSALSPAFFSVACVKYLEDGISREVIYYAVSGISGTATMLFVIYMIKMHSETISFTAKKIKSNDAMIFAFAVSYFIPFIAKASDLTVGITVTITIASVVMFWFMSAIPPHPMLRLLSYRFYEVESASGVVYTLVSQRELRDPKQIKRVKLIASSMLMEVP